MAAAPASQEAGEPRPTSHDSEPIGVPGHGSIGSADNEPDGFAEPVPRKVSSGPSPLSSDGAGGSCVEINH